MDSVVWEKSINTEFITEQFDEPILYAPARVENTNPCNKLKIITAFTDIDRISTHAIALAEGMKNNRFTKGISIEILLGMTKSSLSQKKHEDIRRLVRFLGEKKENPKVSCRYIVSGQEVHSKVYIWGTPDETFDIMPSIAYCGSLNYTMNAFYKRRESLAKCNQILAAKYFFKLYPDTLDCLDDGVYDLLGNITNGAQEVVEDPDILDNEWNKYDNQQPIDTLRVSLLSAKGEVGYGSGINWGIRPNGTKRNQNQAYIPYNRADKKLGFFPDRINPDDENCPMFKVITPDFGSFHMRMAQAGNKALHSVESNAIIGEWIRNRIGVPSGGFVTKQMLEHSGKTYVTFRKYADGTYLLDY